MPRYYALRYRAEVPYEVRDHGPTLGRWSSWLDADTARETRKNADLLEVVEREGGGCDA